MNHRTSISWLANAAGALALVLTPVGPAAFAQDATPPPGQVAQPAFSQQALDTMLAPVALYPDALLAQVLMAATYPLDVVQAARFVRANPGLSGDALAAAVEPMAWDPSVKALTQFPSVLAMMDEHLDWTQQLGEAFLAQGDAVMDTVQALRARAYAAGRLRSDQEQRVVAQAPVITIEPAVPEAYWVPYYNPLVVYGDWWWPAHPPFLWVPPVAYRPPRFAEVYTAGIVLGAATVVVGALWNNPRPVWRDRYAVVNNSRVTNVIVTHPRAAPPAVWHHDPAHRGRVEFRGGPGAHREPGFPGRGSGPRPGIAPPFPTRPGEPGGPPARPREGPGGAGPGRFAPPPGMHAPVPRPPAVREPPAGREPPGTQFRPPGARPPDRPPPGRSIERPPGQSFSQSFGRPPGARPGPESYRTPPPERALQGPARPRPPQPEFTRPPRMPRAESPASMRRPDPSPQMRPAPSPAQPASPMRSFQPPPQARPGPQHEPRGGPPGRGESRQQRENR